MSDYKAHLLAVQIELENKPDASRKKQLLELKGDLEQLIELSSELDQDNEQSSSINRDSSSQLDNNNRSSRTHDSQINDTDNLVLDNNVEQVKSIKGPALTEEERLLKRKKEKNKKKKAKLREKIKEQLDVAESEKQSWQSFANKKGLKGVNKKSIFASPISLTGKVGVGTNGIADAPSTVATNKQASSSAAAAASGKGATRRKY